MKENILIYCLKHGSLDKNKKIDAITPTYHHPVLRIVSFSLFLGIGGRWDHQEHLSMFFCGLIWVESLQTEHFHQEVNFEFYYPSIKNMQFDQNDLTFQINILLTSKLFSDPNNFDLDILFRPKHFGPIYSFRNISRSFFRCSLGCSCVYTCTVYCDCTVVSLLFRILQDVA